MAVAARRLLIAAGGSFVPPAYSIPTATLLGYLAGGVTKYVGNPVLPKGSSGAWDDWGVRELSPVIDQNGLTVTESDGVWGYYWGTPDGTTAFKIGLAKSTDSGQTWTRYGGNPIISGSGSGWMQTGIFQPTVVKQAGGTRVMLAAGRDVSSVDSIGCLTSTDGLTWTDAGQKLTLASFTDGGTAIAEIGVPNMIRRSSGDYLVLLECRTTGVTNGWKVYGATASDPTGSWTVLNSGNPLLGPTGVGWESVGVANPHVIENEPGSYFLIYNGISTFWQVGVAYGTSLTSWTRYGSNPILTKGAGAAWDNQQVETDFLYKEPGSGKLRFLYQGYSTVDGSMQVGLASTP